MERQQHEDYLNELLNPEIEQSRRTEILQELRQDYGTILADITEKDTVLEKLQNDNNDLVISNSKLFRQIGIIEDGSKNPKEEQKEFSETISLEQLERGSI